MQRQSLVVLISSLLLLPCGRIELPNQSPPNRDSEAYAVYSAVLPSEWPVSAAKAKRLVIKAETVSYEMCLRPEKASEEVLGAAISQYLKLNEQVWQIQPNFNIGIKYEVVTDDELKKTLRAGGWEGFYKRFPESGGWIEFSAVGFSRDKTVAVV